VQGYDRGTGKNASKEEIGVNSAGVAISNTETIFNSDGALKADPYVEDTGLVEDTLSSVLLPQAKSARQGVVLLGRLIQKIGAGEGTPCCGAPCCAVLSGYHAPGCCRALRWQSGMSVLSHLRAVQ